MAEGNDFIDIELIEGDEEAEKTLAASALEQAKVLAKKFSIEEVKSGDWFWKLLRMVIDSYNRNARADYFQKKYPGLPPDEIADKLTSVVIRYATIIGAIAGAAVTASQVAALSSGGMTAALFVTTIGAEMLSLAYIQMRLVLDLSVIYDLQLDPEDPEDILMVFGYALGVAPTDVAGKIAVKATQSTTTYAIKKYISKGTLKAIQDVARRLGFKILQRTIIKYAVPIASAAVGAGYNYVTTQSIGKIAKAHFKNRGNATEELRALVSRRYKYSLAFPAAVMYMAKVDGKLDRKEMEFYKSLLSRLSFEGYDLEYSQRLMNADEETILEAIAVLDDEMRHSLIEVLILMAAYDGELADEERDFLVKVAHQLEIPITMDEIQARADEYRVELKEGLMERTAAAVGSAASKAINVAGDLGSTAVQTFDKAGQTTKSAAEAVTGKAAIVSGTAATSAKKGLDKVGTVTTSAGSKFAGTVSGIFGRKKNQAEELTCPNCGESAPSSFRYCPSCGTSLATEKECAQCGEVISVKSQFCPMCGAEQ